MNKAFLNYQSEVEKQIHQVWMPHDGQLDIVSAFFIDWVTGIFLQCGRKMGKTELAVYVLYMFGILFEGAECYFIADEKDHARKILWDNGRLPRFFSSFKRLNNESIDDFKRRREIGLKLQEKWVVGSNSTDMTTSLFNDSKIFVDGAKNYSKADGLSPTIVVYDEFKHHDPRFDIAMRPNLMALGGRILIMGTPPDNEDNYYCETTFEFQNKKDHLFFQRPSYMNPHVYSGPDDELLIEEERIYRLKKRYHVFAREYLAQIMPDEESMIFPNLDVKKHWGDYDEMLATIKRSFKDWDFFISFDPGSVKCFGVLFCAINKYDKRIYALDEIYETDQRQTTVKKIMAKAMEKWRNINAYDDDWYMVHDNQAAWFGVEVLQEFEIGIHSCTKDVNNKEAKLSVIKDAIFTNRFLMSNRCPKTWWEMTNYKKDESGRIPKENDHNIDNLRYILNAAYYDSVPKEIIDLDKISNRRSHTIESDFNRNNEVERLLGGIDEFIDY